VTCTFDCCKRKGIISILGFDFCYSHGRRVATALRAELHRLACEALHRTTFGAVTDDCPRMAKEEPGQCAG